VMGLDNVLAVAGAAQGSYLLVALGLAISVPIVVWGSTLVLRVVERFPAVVYLGAGVLVFTAVKMMRSEPLLGDVLGGYADAGLFLYLLVPAVLWAGLAKNHRKLDSRIRARLADFAPRLPSRASGVPAVSVAPDGTRARLRVLLPVDGSRNALHAVRHVLDEYRRDHDLAVVLINVQRPFSRHVARFVARRDRAAFHRGRAAKALGAARRLLDAHQVPYDTMLEIGERAQVICDVARNLGCHHIVLGTAKRSSLTRMLEDSVTNQVLEQTTVPVEIVTGASISKLERYCLPIGIGAAIGLLLLALD